jgi:hypothetical protein
MKNSSDIIGNRTRDLPACSAVPQPNAPPPASRSIYYRKKKDFHLLNISVPKTQIQFSAKKMYYDSMTSVDEREK